MKLLIGGASFGSTYCWSPSRCHDEHDEENDGDHDDYGGRNFDDEVQCFFYLVDFGTSFHPQYCLVIPIVRDHLACSAQKQEHQE